jgi:hypothetical protein
MTIYRRRLSAVSLLVLLLLVPMAAGCGSHTAAGRTSLPGSNMATRNGQNRPLLTGETGSSTFK